MTHSHNCEQRIADDCQKCFSYAQYLYDHAKRCTDEDCTADRCQIIKANILDLGSFPAQKWNSELEKVFFGPPVQFQASQGPSVNINSLFPRTKSEMSDEEIVSLYKQKRDQEVRKRKLECHQQVTTDHSAEFEDKEVGSSHYLHEAEKLSCTANVNRPPPDPFYNVGFSSTQMSSSSPVGTGVRDNVRLQENQENPLIEENTENTVYPNLLNSIDSEYRSKVVAEDLLQHRKKTQIGVKQPIAVREVTLPGPGKVEKEVPLGLDSNTTDHRQQRASEQVQQLLHSSHGVSQHSQRQKDSDDETVVLWPLNPVSFTYP